MKMAGDAAHPPHRPSQGQSQGALEIRLSTGKRWVYGFGNPDSILKTTHRLIQNPHVFDWLVVTMSAILLFGAYFTAYAYVYTPSKILQPAATIGQSIVLGALLVIAALMFAELVYSIRSGRPWNEALPDGYFGSLAAALLFGLAWLVDTQYWTPDLLAPSALGLDALFTPPHLVEIAATAVIVSGPLRASARRGESEAGFVVLVSAAMLLSVITFATQFLHPLIDPWGLTDYPFKADALAWVQENIGVAAILAQALILSGAALLLNSGFKLRLGSLTFVFLLNGALVTTTKLHYDWLPVMLATGLAGDAWLWWSRRRPGLPSASLCAVVGTAFTASYTAEVAIRGTDWRASIWLGTIVATAMMCWLMGRLLRAGLPSVIVAQAQPSPPAPASNAPATAQSQPPWPRDPVSPNRALIVRGALDDLGTPEALGRSPLAKLAGISRDGGTAAGDLRAALIDVITEIAASTDPRDAEAGRLLLNYYVKKVGSHEVIMERLHLSHPTYYRRLNRGFNLIAEKLDEMAEFASITPVAG
jgi:hypothetical protein